MMPSEKPVKRTCRIIIGLFGIRYILESSKIVSFAVCSYVGAPKVIFGVIRNTLQSTFVGRGFFGVMHVLLPRSTSQIFNSIIVANPVDVIKLAVRPFAVVNSPRHSMCSYKNIINSNNNITRPVKARDTLSSPTLTSIHTPIKMACVRRVRKQLAQSFNRYVSHKWQYGNILANMQAVFVIRPLDGRVSSRA